MTKFKLFHLKNEMLIANFLANFIGVFFSSAMLYMAEGFPDKQMWQQPLFYWVDALFTPFAFTFVGVMTLLYEKPIRRYLNLSFKQTAIPPDLESKARRRLLNEPFVLIALSLNFFIYEFNLRQSAKSADLVGYEAVELFSSSVFELLSC